MAALVRVIDLGRMRYRDALAAQREAHARVLAARGNDPAAPTSPAAPVGELLLVEHDPPVVTLGRRSTSRDHLVASPARLAQLGVELEESDRGGDVTWHGPGQLVVYPILDLERLALRIHPYMRMLEEIVIEVLVSFGVRGERDPEATGVWVGVGASPRFPSRDSGAGTNSRLRKICAMGVRVSRWVSMHGLALNVEPDLGQFELIVPCGLHGRAVTSLRRELGDRAPGMEAVRGEMIDAFERALAARPAQARASRAR